MKRSKFMSQQIIVALKQAETGVSVAEVCRKQRSSGDFDFNAKHYRETLVEDHGFVLPTSWADEYKRIFKLFETNLKAPAQTNLAPKKK